MASRVTWLSRARPTTSCSVEHGAVLHSRAAEPCDLIVIPGADHRLTDPGHRRTAVDASLAWFRRFLPERAA